MQQSGEGAHEEDVKAGDAKDEGGKSPKLHEAMEQGEGFTSDAPGGGTHDEEVGKPAWGEKEGDLTGQEGKQSQHGGAPG